MDYVAERHRQHHLIAAAAAETVPICSDVVVACADCTNRPRCRPRGCADVFHGNGPETAVGLLRLMVVFSGSGGGGDGGDGGYDAC